MLVSKDYMLSDYIKFLQKELDENGDGLIYIITDSGCFYPNLYLDCLKDEDGTSFYQIKID